MSVSLKNENVNKRPFVYYQIKNRDKQGSNIFSREESGGDKIKLTISYNDETGTVTLMSSGTRISYNAASGSVTLTLPTRMVTYNASGTVTINGTST